MVGDGVDGGVDGVVGGGVGGRTGVVVGRSEKESQQSHLPPPHLVITQCNFERAGRVIFTCRQ